VFNTIIVHVHNRINNFEVGELIFDFKVSTYLNNIVQLEHDGIDQSGNVIEKKKVDKKNTNFNKIPAGLNTDRTIPPAGVYLS
jgi:hypothetical protein